MEAAFNSRRIVQILSAHVLHRSKHTSITSVPGWAVTSLGKHKPSDPAHWEAAMVSSLPQKLFTQN